MEADERVLKSRDGETLRGALAVLNELNAKAKLNRSEELINTLRDVAPIAVRYSFSARLL